MKTRKWADISAQHHANPANAARIEAHQRAMRDTLALARLRADRGLTQRDVAAALTVSPARVSKLEHQEDIYLSTLREYVAALGGALHVNVEFPEETIEFLAAT